MRALRAALCILTMAAACAAAIPANAGPKSKAPRPAATGTTQIGVGHGIAFLPIYLAQDLKLFEKHGRAAGLPARFALRRFPTAAAMQDALARGEIHTATFGVSALLLVRDGKGGTAEEPTVISGLTTLPLVLLTARRDIRSLADLKPNDRIAVPALTAPQVSLLRLHAERTRGVNWERLQKQIVVMPHEDALAALTGERNQITAYFASPPFSQLAARDPKARILLTSADVMDGKASFLVIAATRGRLTAQPALAQAVARAIDEAAGIIRNDPRRAAMTYLKYEPSDRLDVRAIETALREIKDEFGSGVFGVAATAKVLTGERRLQSPPASWKDVVAPVLQSGPGS